MEFLILTELESLQFLKNELGDVNTIVPGRGSITDLSEVDRMEATLHHLQETLVEYVEGTPDGSEAPLVADKIMSHYDAPLPHKDWTRQQLIHVLDHVALVNRDKSHSDSEADAETQL